MEAYLKAELRSAIIDLLGLTDILGYDSPQQVTTEITDAAQQLYVNPQDRVKLIAALQQGAVTDFTTWFMRRDARRPRLQGQVDDESGPGGWVVQGFLCCGNQRQTGGLRPGHWVSFNSRQRRRASTPTIWPAQRLILGW